MIARYTNLRLEGLALPFVVAVPILAMLAIGLRLSLLVLPSLFAVSLSFWLVQKTTRVLDLRHLTISGFWYLCYVATIYIPSFFIYMEAREPYRSRFLFSVQATLVMVPLGFLVVNLLSKFNTREIRANYESPIERSPSESGLSTTYVLLLAGAVGLTLLYLSEVQEIALFEILKNPVDWAYYVAVRLASFTALESRFDYVYALLRGALYPLLIVIALGYYLRLRKSFWLVVLLVSVFAGTLYAALDAAKGPVSLIFMTLGFFVYLYKAGRIKKSALALWGGLLLAFPLFVLITVGGESSREGLQAAVETLGHRIFVTNSSVAYEYFEIFPNEVGFLHGRSIEKFAWLTGEPFFDTGEYVFEDMYSKSLEGNSAGGAFFAKFYADFGTPGVLAGGLLTGIILQGMQVFLVRRRKTILQLATYAFLFYAAFQINGESLPSVLLGRGVVLALVFPWVVAGISAIFASPVVQTVKDHA